MCTRLSNGIAERAWSLNSHPTLETGTSIAKMLLCINLCLPQRVQQRALSTAALTSEIGHPLKYVILPTRLAQRGSQGGREPICQPQHKPAQ